MKIKLNNKYVRWGVTVFCVIAASILFFYFIFRGEQLKSSLSDFTNILMPIVLGFVTAYLMTPVLNFIEYRILIPLYEKLKIKHTKARNVSIRVIGIILTLLLVISLISGMFYMLLSQIIPSVSNIVSSFDVYIENITAWLNKTLDNNPELGEYVINLIDKYSVELETFLNDTILQKTSEIIKTVSLSIISVLGLLWDFIIGFIISIYLMAGKETFAAQSKKIVYAFFKRDTANTILKNFRYTHKTFIGFIGGKIIDSAIIGVLCFIGVSILKIPYPALISLVIGITNIIPFFGPFLGAIPCSILIFVVDPLNPQFTLYFVLFIFLLQQFDGNILGPMILGDSTGLSSFWVIFSITFFGGIWGVPGMIVGVPVFAVIYAGIRSTINTRLNSKELTTETLEYVELAYVDEDGNQYMLIPDYKKEKIRKEKSSRKKIRKVGSKEKKSNQKQAEITPNIPVNNEFNSNENITDSES